MGLKAKLLFLIRQFPFVYPPAIIYSCEEWINNREKQKGKYIAQRGPWCRTIFPEGFINNPPPLTVGTANEKAFYNNRSYPTAKASLFYLQNCYLFGYQGLVLTIKNEVFQEFSHHFGVSSLKKFFLKTPFYLFTRNARKVEGIGAVLISPKTHNYYHWLSDVLPRVKLYEEVMDQIDHFCIAANVPEKFLDILIAFGISKEKIILVNELEKLRFDYLYVSSLPGSEGRSPKWAVDYLRNKLLPMSVRERPSRAFYFQRGANAQRKILNEDIIISCLKATGFEIIDPDGMSVPEQIDLMQDATVVIGAHGAALSNLLFSKDKIAVVEIFSPDYFRTDCYYTLSALRKLNYWYIVGDKPAGVAWGDIIVPEDLLLKTIEQANSR